MNDQYNISGIEIKETGGARIGMANATWPFAKLFVNKNELQLYASIIGRFSFSPSDIIAIEPYKLIPILGQGIRIYHRVPNYNSKIIFWTLSSPEGLIERIRQTGFLYNSDNTFTDKTAEIFAAQSKGSFPIKTSAIIIIVAVWNILFLYNFFNIKGKSFPIGIGAEIGLAFLFLTGLGLLISPQLRKLVLKEGHHIDEIKSFVYFQMFITGIMLLLFIFLYK